MKAGSDPHHDKTHIDQMLDHLDYLLSRAPALASRIDFSVLLPAICWHDVWVSQHTAKNIIELLTIQIIEGIKSASLWYIYAKNKLAENQVKQIHFCIRKHSSLQLIPSYTLEAKLLIDLDKLEIWNIHRFTNKHATLVSGKNLYSKWPVRLYYHYSYLSGLYFQELSARLNSLSKGFWSETK